jgi:hypothetical protein
MEDFDPRAYLERLIVEATCEWCGQTHWTQEAGSTRWVTDVERGWFCREQKGNGYTSKHWRVWRVCFSCRHSSSFDKWVFPVIANMPEIDIMQALVQVQPMQVPAAQVFYMDLVVGPGRPGRRRHAVDLAAPEADRTIMTVVKNRQPVRGRTKHVMMLDDANFRCVDR